MPKESKRNEIEFELQIWKSTAERLKRDLEAAVEKIVLLEQKLEDTNYAKEIHWLEQESMRREFSRLMMAQIDAERTFEHEKEKIIQHVKEKY
ncbi:hypothetical protein DVH24_021267 [Malus domestica]|uniref:Uncharacterized protein n=1 Tax=Malus domestica TaxID=3750 RepID=A0A498HX03_MALDO|nr:hypothetical protein DVH24_021267 [Malus domestica]